MKHEGLQNMISLLLITLGAVLPSVSSKCSFPAIFNFGDSTSDTGNIHYSFPYMTLAERPPYGMTYFHKPVYRYSDGRLLIDFIAQGLGKPFLSPYLQSVDSNFSGGANFASSGATAAPVMFISPFTLNVQVNEYTIFKQKVLETIASKGQQSNIPTPDAFTKGLFVLHIGGNDISYGFMNLNLTVDQILSAWLPNVTAAIAKGIQDLYWQGARNFWVLDVNPQGCLPFALSRYPHTEADIDSYGCAEPYNNVARHHNMLLKAELTTLGQQLPDAKVIYVNTYDIQYDIVKNAASYGFSYATRACCGVGGEYNFNYYVQCALTNITFNGQRLSALACTNPSQYVSWDGVHLTDRANQILASKILSSSYFFPSFPLSSFCHIYPLH